MEMTTGEFHQSTEEKLEQARACTRDCYMPGSGKGEIVYSKAKFNQLFDKAISSVVLESLEQRRMLTGSVKEDPIGDDHDHGLSVLYVPETTMLQNPGGFLSKARSGDKFEIARNFLLANTDDLGLTREDIEQAIVAYQYTDENGAGATHIYMRQGYLGQQVWGAELGIHLTADGRVSNVNSSFIPGLSRVTGPAPSAPAISPVAALQSAADVLEVDLTSTPRYQGHTDGMLTYSAPELSMDPIKFAADYFITDSGPELTWHFNLNMPNHNSDWYDLGVASDGTMAFATNWTNRATYNVYPLPTASPALGGRSMVTDPHDLTASPFGWHDTDGVAGADSTLTVGNNVQAQEDTDANNTGGLQPDGTAALNFDFPIDLTQAPSTYRPAAITNLFYWNNVLHDVHYKYGFTSAARNFQTNTYGLGGLGNDAVRADAQDGSGTNNANFSTPADGSHGRMQMYLFTAPTPDIDGDLDTEVIAHEYGHGVSNRLTGAGSGSLGATMSGGMGEGWSDFFSLMFTQLPSDTQNQAYPVGTYVLNQPPTTGAGIRRRPYSFDMTIDPLTFGAYGSSGTTSYGITRSTQVHNTGELWCSALWDMNWLLINKFGYDPDLYTGYTAAPGPGNAGNKLAMQLVLDGMKLQPANPSFTQARNAILQADVNLTGGANQNEIWQAFARRGLGASASTAGSTSTANFVEAFDVPWPDPTISAATPTGSNLGTANSMTFTFSEAMDPTSFSVASDVTSFTGPSGNLLGAITGFTWLNATQLRVNFATQVSDGAYSMTIGPDILAQDNGNPMDQNRNGILGEAADNYTNAFSLQQFVGPDGFGYKAGEYQFESIDLVPGGAGVTTVLNAGDDIAGAINLGADTFNFYGVSVTGATGLFVNSNGLLTTDSSTTAFTNSDLTTSPTQRSIAVMWDDWVTNNVATVGPDDDCVLTKFEDLNGDLINDRLIIEWSSVRRFSSTASPATFQAILQLNTGATPGRMIFNYVDLIVGNTTYDNGLSATLGIKDTGTQGANRLVVSRDAAMPWAQNGKAILVALDVTPPRVNAATYSYLTSQQTTIAFSEDVGASFTAADVTLENLTTSTTIPPGAYTVSYSGGSQTATINFPGYQPDGNYRITLNANGITDAAGNPLDGDGNGVAGGNFTSAFHILGGDADHNRSVNGSDFNAMATNFGTTSGMTYPAGDFDYDGDVDSGDFNILATRFGVTLAPGSEAARGGGSSSGTGLPGGSDSSGFAGIFGDSRIGKRDSDGSDDDGDDDSSLPLV